MKNAAERAKALIADLGVEIFEDWESSALARDVFGKIVAALQEAENAGRAQRLETTDDLQLFTADELGFLKDCMPTVPHSPGAQVDVHGFVEAIRGKLDMANVTPSYYVVPLTRAALLLRQINNLQHAGVTVDAYLWADAYHATEKALGRLPVNIIEVARSDEA